MAACAWNAVVDSWREESPGLSEKVRQLAEQAVLRGPGQPGGPEQLGDLPEFADLVRAIDCLRMREAGEAGREFLADVILRRRYDEVLTSLGNSLHDQLASAVFDYLRDLDDVNWTGPAFDVKMRDIVVVSADQQPHDQQPAREQLRRTCLRVPAEEKAGRLKELIAARRGLRTDQLALDQVDDSQPLRDPVVVWRRRERDSQAEVNNWPACEGRAAVLELLRDMQIRPLSESPDGTWDGTAEFARIMEVLSWLVQRMTEQTRGGRASKDKKLNATYKEIADFLRDAAVLPGACPQSILDALNKNFSLA